jgi:hypothetical protein
MGREHIDFKAAGDSAEFFRLPLFEGMAVSA